MKSLCFVIISLCVQFASAQTAVLHISVEDNVGVTSHTTNQINSFLESYGVEKSAIKTISVKHSRDVDDTAYDQNKDELVAKLGALSKENIVFSHLIINTHGKTSFDPETGESTSELELLGNFSESSIDGELLEVFEPFRHMFAKDTRVVLNACNTMCGTDHQAGKRAEVFLNYLNAPEGSIYGAKTAEMALYFADLNRLSFRDVFISPSHSSDYLIRDSGQFAVGVTVLSALIASLPLLDFDLSVGFLAKLLASSYGFMFAVKITELKTFAENSARKILDGELNLGTLSELRDGEIISQRAIQNERKGLQDIYFGGSKFACSAFL